MSFSPLLEYKTQATDTSPEIDRLLVQRWREFKIEQKAELITGLTRGCRQLSLMGIHQQYPKATPALIRLEYIRRRLGEKYVNLMGHRSNKYWGRNNDWESPDPCIRHR